MRFPLGVSRGFGAHIPGCGPNAAAGALIRYRFDLATGAAGPAEKIGGGWNEYRQVFAGAGGSIYGVSADDKLWYYQDRFAGGVAGREYIGSGFRFREMVAGLDR